MIKIALVDDQELVRSGLAMLIDSQPDLTVIAQASDGQQALDDPQITGEAEVILMDIRMPVLNGIEATRKILQLNSKVRIIALTTFDLDEYVLDAIDAGASGFLLKDAPAEQLLLGIRSVHRGDAVIAPSATRRLLKNLIQPPSGANAEASTKQAAHSPEIEQDAAALATLTSREREVLLLMAEGLSNAEIGERLFISQTTIKTHVSNILHKLGARDRVQAVVMAYRAGLVTGGNG